MPWILSNTSLSSTHTHTHTPTHAPTHTHTCSKGTVLSLMPSILSNTSPSSTWPFRGLQGVSAVTTTLVKHNVRLVTTTVLYVIYISGRTLHWVNKNYKTIHIYIYIHIYTYIYQWSGCCIEHYIGLTKTIKTIHIYIYTYIYQWSGCCIYIKT